MYKINFNHLYYFLTIASEGSIVKASKKLHMSQPALSHQLKTLELDLGRKLFDRIGRRLKINENGEHVRDYATKIFRHSEEMVTFLKSETQTIIKIIKIGTVPWLSKGLVEEFIRPLILNKYIRVQVFQKNFDSLIKDIQSQQLDIVLCDSPYSGRSQKLQGQKIDSESIFCVASSFSGYEGSFPANLNEKKVINYIDSCKVGQSIDQFIKTNKLASHVVGEFADSSLIRKTVENGGVYAFLPESVVRTSLKSNKLIKLGVLNNIKFSTWAVTRKDLAKDGLINSLFSRYKKKSKV